jgi:hypothetical protein|tara:strand:+ start:629 stop:967 length:339 start_codon:yes stop_codon:yes gene_type:complete
MEEIMARPKPTVLLEYTDQTYRSEQILAADAIYAVVYQGAPINLKSFNSLVNAPGAKYKKTSFCNSGHAFNLAERLNKKFKTTEFMVVKLVNGERIEKDISDGDFRLAAGRT